MNPIKVLGIDLAKRVFHVHGGDANGKRVLRKRLPRISLMVFMAQWPLCLVGIKACGSAHCWARQFGA